MGITFFLGWRGKKKFIHDSFCRANNEMLPHIYVNLEASKYGSLKRLIFFTAIRIKVRTRFLRVSLKILDFFSYPLLVL